VAGKKQYGAADNYEKKLERVMERLGADGYNYNFDRFACFVEFRYKGQLYRFDHSIEGAKSRGIDLKYGSDAFAQVVLSLEDLARMVERGIYDLQVWVAGMKMLPAATEIPACFIRLGFTAVPQSEAAVDEKFRALSKLVHPDQGGDSEEMKALLEAREEAKTYFGKER
jgi:hypothetical protein